MQIPEYVRVNSIGTIKTDDPYVRFNAIFSNYDARYVRTNDYGFVKEYFIGRGSLSAIKGVVGYTLDENISPILEVGRMCNFARGITIFVDGEHKNDEVINMAFNQFPDARSSLRNAKEYISPVRSKGKTVIGSGVILARGATVLSGVKIGDGAVIGTQAIVTKDIPAFSIAVGNPARVVSYRFDEETIKKLEEIRWWDFEFNYLFSNMGKIQRMKTDEFIASFGDISKNKYVTSTGRFVFKLLNKENQVKCIGCDLDGKFVPYDSLNDNIKFYIEQMLNIEDEQIYLVKNILDCRES